MARLRHQEGVTMIMLLCLSVALAVMAAAVVMVIGNDQGNTLFNRQHTETIDVAEAGLNNAMYTLGSSWPTGMTSSLDTLPASTTAASRAASRARPGEATTPVRRPASSSSP